MANDQNQKKSSPSAESLSEHEIRLKKVEELRKQGIEPWPGFKPVNATCKDVIDEFKEDKESRVYEVAGRILTLREHGKTIFADIQDRSGKLQLYIKKDAVGEQAFEVLKNYIDIGDFLWVTGTSFKTKMGEITVKVTAFELISKCLFPLPEKFHGLADIETIYRQRYLDLISNPESKERFLRRSKIIQVIRDFLLSHDFIEVETPMLHPIPGGALAKPFVTHHNALDSDFYLRIAPELYLKRLVVGGLERVFEINRNFRNEGISTKHNPEFTMVEFYMAHQNYVYAMDLVESMLRKVVMQVCNTLEVPFGTHMLNFEKPFRRIPLAESLIEMGGLAQEDITEKNIDKTIKKHKISLARKDASYNEKIYALFEELVEPKLIQPTFITHFPIEVSPLAKRDEHNPTIAARFELFIGGMELSNAFNELNDPLDQAERFKDQAVARASGDEEGHYFDAEYVHALQHALPPTVGVGIGIDRLAMLVTNTTSIKDVILFPTLKRKD